MKGKMRRRASFRTRQGGVALLVTAGLALAACTGAAAAGRLSARETALAHARAQSAAWPAAKASLYQKDVAAAFPSTHAAKPTGPLGPMPAPGVPQDTAPDQRKPGITNLREAPFGQEDFAVINEYSGMVKGRWYVTYAGTVGGQGADAGSGGLKILSADAGSNTNLADVGTFPLAGTRHLRITGYTKSSVTVITDTGASRTLNLDTLKFT